MIHMATAQTLVQTVTTIQYLMSTRGLLGIFQETDKKQASSSSQKKAPVTTKEFGLCCLERNLN